MAEESTAGLSHESAKSHRRFRWLRRFLPHLICFVAIAGASLLGGLRPIEHALMDLRFGLLKRAATGSLILVEIDGRSLAELDTWPWPRSYHAALIDRLSAAGARRIAFDVDFSSRSDPESDALLAAALDRAGQRVILPVFKQHASLARDEHDLHFTSPLPMFAEGALLASVNLRPEADGLVRRYALTEVWNGSRIPALAAQLADPAGARAHDFYIDFGIDPTSIPHVSYADVLRGRVSADLFVDRSVIVGATAIELGDQLAVPIYRILSGSVLQALAYESLAQGRALTRSSQAVSLLVALLLAALLGPRFQVLPWRIGLGVLAACTTGAVALSVAAQAVAAISLDIATWILLPAISYLAVVLRELDRFAGRIRRKGMALIQRTVLMNAVVQDSFDGILICDSEGRIEIANPAAAAMLGGTPGGIRGRSVGELLDLSLVGDPPASREAGNLVPGGSIRFPPIETTLRRPTGDGLPVELVRCVSSVRGSRRRFDRRHEPRTVHIYTFRDISERRRAEEAQKTALREAVAASRAKTRFIANMSHELRTPLNAIIGFSEIIKDQLFGPVENQQYIRYAADIHGSGTHLLGVIGNILDISHVEGGTYELNEAVIEVGKAVAEAVARVTDIADRKQIGIEIRLHPMLPRLRADPKAFDQVLFSVLTNAVKFTENGGRARVTGEVDAAGGCVIEVADTGIGIAPEELQRVVRPFYQVDSSLARKYQGMGLGLPLASGLMELHGGSLSIESGLGIGTRVTMRFPPGRSSTGESDQTPSGAAA